MNSDITIELDYDGGSAIAQREGEISVALKDLECAIEVSEALWDKFHIRLHRVLSSAPPMPEGDSGCGVRPSAPLAQSLLELSGRLVTINCYMENVIARIEL